MRLRVLALAASLALAGCQQVAAGISAFNYLNGVTVTQDDMDKAVAAYDLVVLIPFNNYRYTDAPTYKVPRRYCTDSAPFSLASPCAKASVISLVQPYIGKSETARLKLQDCVATHCTGVKALAAAFQSAWDAAQGQVTAQVAANQP